MAERSESDLVQRFREGDDGAFRTLFLRYEAGLRARLQGRIPAAVRKRISVSDVVQETCLVALRRRRDFEDRGPEAFRRWVAGIADLRLREEVRRHAGAARRSARREVTREARPDTAFLREVGRGPGTLAASAELAARAEAVMRSLPPAQAEVLRLALREHLTLREAAQRMGRSREAVKKLYGRALCRLRAELGGDLGP